MSYIINKKTGRKYPVTADELTIIRGNKATKNLFTYHITEEPEEVKKLKASRGTGQRRRSGNASSSKNK